MNYKNSITYNINSIKSMNKLNNSYKKLEKIIDTHRLKIFTNRNWEKQHNTKVDFSELFDSLLKRETPKLEKTNEKEIENIIDNTFDKFHYSLNENCSYDFEDNLKKLVLNDEVKIIDNVKYSKSLFDMFFIINYQKNLLNEFLKIKDDDTIPLKEKGVAFSSNRDISEVLQSIKNDVEDILKLVNKNEELERILKGIKNFEKKPYEAIIILSTINENTFKYLKNENDIEILKIILKMKKRLNASQGLKETDFIHSMRFWTISFFPFSEINRYGFDNQTDFIDFLNDLLENIVDIDYFKYDARDLNKEIQLKDLFFDKPIMEKITKKNKKKHPIYDNPRFLKLFRDLLQLSLKKSQYKIKR
ncbi:hypothetical protein ACMC56_03975 [Campylobacterota bacterium DY0563]